MAVYISPSNTINETENVFVIYSKHYLYISTLALELLEGDFRLHYRRTAIRLIKTFYCRCWWNVSQMWFYSSTKKFQTSQSKVPLVFCYVRPWYSGHGVFSGTRNHRRRIYIPPMRSNWTALWSLYLASRSCHPKLGG